MADIAIATEPAAAPAAPAAPPINPGAASDHASYFPKEQPTPRKDAALAALQKKAKMPGTNDPVEPVKPTPPPTPADPDDEPAPTAEGDEPTTPEPKPETEQPPAKPKTKGDFLRAELAKVKSERDTYKKEIETLKTTPRDDPEKKTLSEKLTAMEKKHQAIEDEYRLHAYEKSQEYKEKYEKPYVDAYMRGRNKVTSLETTLPDGTARASTPEDFDAIMQVTNDRHASKLAKEMFGDDAHIVIHHRERVLEANAARAASIEEARKNGAEKQKQFEEMTTKQRESVRKAFETNVKAKEEKLEWLKEVEGDQPWNDALKRGTELAAKSWMDRSAKTPEEQAELDAANYNRARAYSTLKLSNKRLQTRVDALALELKQYKASEPGKGEGKTGEEAPAAGGSAMERAQAGLLKRAKPVNMFL